MNSWAGLAGERSFTFWAVHEIWSGIGVSIGSTSQAHAESQNQKNIGLLHGVLGRKL